VLDGSREREARWTERWTFALREDAATPWIVADAGDAPVAGSTA